MFALVTYRRIRDTRYRYAEVEEEANAPLLNSGVGVFTTTVNVRSAASTTASVVAKYTAGQTVNYDKLVKAQSRTWISYISSSGPRRYCCAIDSNGAQYIYTKGAGGSTPTPPPSKPSTGGVYLNIPQYYQWQYKNAYGYGGTIASSGCGPTCFAMYATYKLGRTVTPVNAITWCGDRYYAKGQGTYWSYFAAACKHFGIGAPSQVTSSSAVTNALRNGQAVISSQRPGIFTRGGHFILLVGIDGSGRIRVNDPNDNSSKNFRNRAFNMATEIHKTAAQYWILPKK